MRVIVSGGAGFIGTNLIKKLLEDGNDISKSYHRNKIVSLDNYTSGTKKNEQNGCTYYNADISKIPDYDFFMSKPDIIFHLAAKARIAPSFDVPVDYYKSNVTGTLNLLEWARRKKCKLIYAGSSSYHYGLYKNMYTFSKWQGEELCKLYSNVFNVPTAICRFYNVYGDHMIIDGDFAPAIGIWMKQYLENKPLTITGTGEQRRDFTYAGDIVDGLIRSSDGDYKGNEFELGHGKNYSINEITSWFNINVKYIPAREGEAFETHRENNSALDVLGWEPKTDLRDWIETWIKERNENGFT